MRVLSVGSDERSSERGDEHNLVADQPRSHHLPRSTARRIERRTLRPQDAAFLIVLLWTIVIVVFGVIERLVEPETFDSVWLGMWWALQTVTTVGYGDVVPEQTTGKAMAVFLMLGGLSLLAVVTGAITSAFVRQADEKRRQTEGDPVMQKLEQVSAQLQQIRTDLGRRPESRGS